MAERRAAVATPTMLSTSIRRELRALVRLATPVVAVQVGLVLMGTVDAMMLGRVSEQALASGALGHAVSFGLIVMGMGMLMALDPLVSQAWGAGEELRVARHLQRGLMLAGALSVPMALLMWDISPALRLFGQAPNIIAPSTDYVRGIIPGVPAFLLFVAVRQSLQAMSTVKPALIAIVVANLANVAANYAMIFGHWGMPRLEVLGSAYATSISRWVMMLTLVLASQRQLRPFLRDFRQAVLRLATYGPMVRLGLPIAIHLSLEMWLFSTVAVVMGRIGSQALAGHQIAIMLASLTFMVPLGIGGAATTRVGNAIGRGDSVGARRAAAVSLGLGASVMAVSATCFAIFPRQLAELFTFEQPVIAVAATLLPIAAVFQIVDGLQVVSSGILRGAADTRVPAMLALVGFWGVGLTLGLVLGLHFDFGPSGLWWGLTVGLASVAVLLLLRLRFLFTGTISRTDGVNATPRA